MNSYEKMIHILHKKDYALLEDWVAELEMISKSDLIRRSVFAEFSKLDEKYRESRPTNWSRLKTA